MALSMASRPEVFGRPACNMKLLNIFSFFGIGVSSSSGALVEVFQSGECSDKDR